MRSSHPGSPGDDRFGSQHTAHLHDHRGRVSSQAYQAYMVRVPRLYIIAGLLVVMIFQDNGWPEPCPAGQKRSLPCDL
jgi:hypothetical protein